MKKENEELELLRRKAETFCDNGLRVHITLKDTFIWKRGFIKEVSSDFFMLDETLEGIQPVFLQEVKDIQIYKEKKEGVV